MPQPEKGEEKEHYISRCIAQVTGEGRTQEQAAGQCYGMWEEHLKALEIPVVDPHIEAKDNPPEAPQAAPAGSEPRVEYKDGIAELEALDDDRHIIKAIISAEIVDSDGEAILIDGIDYTSRYNQNPVLLWHHNRKGEGLAEQTGDDPLGKCIDIKREGGLFIGTFELAKRPEGHIGEWIPDTKYSLAKQGVINAVSMGFIPTEERKPTPKDKAKFGEEVKNVVSKCILVEVSLVPVPDNRLAQIIEVKSLEKLNRKTIIAEVKVIPEPEVKVDEKTNEEAIRVKALEELRIKEVEELRIKEEKELEIKALKDKQDREEEDAFRLECRKEIARKQATFYL